MTGEIQTRDTGFRSVLVVGRRLLTVAGLCLCLGLVFCGCNQGPAAKDVVDLIPLDNDISGWTRTGPMQIAETGQQLYDMIDGEAQPYVDNGFVKCAFQKYSGTVGSNQVELEVRVFDMADTANARKVYEAVTTGSEVPWTKDNPGAAARIEQSLFSYKVDFWGDRFYVWVTIQDATDPGLAVAKFFAGNIWAAIKE